MKTMLTTLAKVPDKAENGQIGIDKVVSKFKNKCSFCELDHYRIIFMDIDMPVKDGF